MSVSIHAPRAGRDVLCDGAAFSRRVSIHAPRAGRDHSPFRKAMIHTVSIHAPRAGRDIERRKYETYLASFNPRAPCGARL